ncbi:MAG: sigma-70 family RNA polymerase sigma factor [Candidatus Hydrogenedentes bacterium]|nr:sigma-70 family RNA polymerase sigma factor [Candidatus Hydrogenedentota bacterium]
MSIPLEMGVLYDTTLVEGSDERKYSAIREEPDKALVSLAQGGARAPFEELVRRYRNDVFALSYHYLHDREEAWDISQEVFIKAHRALGRFRGDASFKTWLLRITANRCKDFFKKRRLKTVALEDMHGGQNAPATAAGPDRAASARELGQAINAALASISEKHRTAFILREFEGLSYKEMSGVMGCSLGTVMSRLHHARKKLQEALIEMGIVEAR